MNIREDVARIIDNRPWSDINPYASHFGDHPSRDHAIYERERLIRQRKILAKTDEIIGLIQGGKDVQ